jgi:hypothetical protein
MPPEARHEGGNMSTIFHLLNFAREDGTGRGIYLKAGDDIVTTIGELGTLRTSFTDPK